jgi:4-hydroxythreonine-4-phosphate dehydrogenase
VAPASLPILAFSQGDPAGVGPEILLALLARRDVAAAPATFTPLLIAERAALAAVTGVVAAPRALHWFASRPSRDELASLPVDTVAAYDPVGDRRAVTTGRSGPADAAGALAALDAGIALAQGGVVDALVTAPVSKESIARHCRPGFVGHTEYLAAACGLERYGRDYLMAFLAPELQVALLSTHLSLRAALDLVTGDNVVDALRLLGRTQGGRIAVAAVNPHAGEGGLLGSEDDAVVRPAVALARAEGIDARGPESADSLFARARRGEFDWVLALYHDQGLIAVKTAAFGMATNWTLGLPFLRTSVDHGTAFPIAGRGIADVGPLAAVVDTTLDLLAGGLPRRTQRDPSLRPG